MAAKSIAFNTDARERILRGVREREAAGRGDGEADECEAGYGTVHDTSSKFESPAVPAFSEVVKRRATG